MSSVSLPREFMNLLSKRVSEARVALSSLPSAGHGDQRDRARLLSLFKHKASLASCMASCASMLVPGVDMDSLASSVGCRWDAKASRLTVLQEDGRL